VSIRARFDFIAKYQERQRLQNADETQVAGLTEESKVEAFETLEFFQVGRNFKLRRRRQQLLDHCRGRDLER
jgi:hypothetical protein